MIVGLYQTNSPAGDLEKGLTVVSSALEQAASVGVQMLVMPEAFLPGYVATPSSPPKGWDKVEARLAGLCRDHQTGLAIGLPDYAAGGPYNCALAFDASGEILARHRKIQLFGADEHALFTPGNAYTVFDYLGTRFGLLICYDVEFPEHARALADMGAKVILVPTANMQPFSNVNQIIVPARAAENAVTIVYANYCGIEEPLAYVGLSAILGPDGHTLGSMGHGEGLCIAELPSEWTEHGIPLSTQRADLKKIV